MRAEDDPAWPDEDEAPKDYHVRADPDDTPPPKWLIRLLAGAALGILVWLLMLLGAYFFASTARAHEAPMGWVYGFECCAQNDCRQEPENAIGETSAGYLVRATGEVIIYADTRVKRSRDEFYHRCALSADFTRERSLCLYVPDRGF